MRPSSLTTLVALTTCASLLTSTAVLAKPPGAPPRVPASGSNNPLPLRRLPEPSTTPSPVRPRESSSTDRDATRNEDHATTERITPPAPSPTDPPQPHGIDTPLVEARSRRFVSALRDRIYSVDPTLPDFDPRQARRALALFRPNDPVDAFYVETILFARDPWFGSERCRITPRSEEEVSLSRIEAGHRLLTLRVLANRPADRRQALIVSHDLLRHLVEAAWLEETARQAFADDLRAVTEAVLAVEPIDPAYMEGVRRIATDLDRLNTDR